MKKKKSILIFSLLFIALLAYASVAVINRLNQKPPEVDLTAKGFVQHSITIAAGDRVHFVNPSSGVTQMLCLGQDQVCYTDANDPLALKQPGLQLAPGQSKDVVFSLEGTYRITSATVPGMNLVVTVNPDD